MSSGLRYDDRRRHSNTKVQLLFGTDFTYVRRTSPTSALCNSRWKVSRLLRSPAWQDGLHQPVALQDSLHSLVAWQVNLKQLVTWQKKVCTTLTVDRQPPTSGCVARWLATTGSFWLPTLQYSLHNPVAWQDGLQQPLAWQDGLQPPVAWQDGLQHEVACQAACTTR